MKPAHSPFGGSVTGTGFALPGVGRSRLQSTREFASIIQLRQPRHSTPCSNDSAPRRTTLESLAGKTIDSYTITSDDVETALRPVLAYVETLLDHPKAEYFLEHRVVFPAIAGAFGTCDLIVRIGSTIHVVDFKFGSGVRVFAIYPDGDVDVINAQLLFYAAAGRYSLPEFFTCVDNIILTILQPVSIDSDADMVSSVEITPAELDEFIAIYRAACTGSTLTQRRAWSGAPITASARLKPDHRPGTHQSAARSGAIRACRTPSALPSRNRPTTCTTAGNDGLSLVDAVKDISTALRDQAKRALESGDLVPGHALSSRSRRTVTGATRATRSPR